MIRRMGAACKSAIPLHSCLFHSASTHTPAITSRITAGVLISLLPTANVAVTAAHETKSLTGPRGGGKTWSDMQGARCKSKVREKPLICSYELPASANCLSRRVCSRDQRYCALSQPSSSREGIQRPAHHGNQELPSGSKGHQRQLIR